MKELRFGDFDGDTKTDMFLTAGWQWWIWYGSIRDWRKAQTASSPITELLVGEFDNVPGTDVVGIANSTWSYSSAGTGFWTRLNRQLTSSLSNCVAADFDGNGKTDIAYSVPFSNTWYVSRDGRFPFTVLRNGEAGLKNALLGQFEGGARTQAVSLNVTPFGLGDRFVIWDGRNVNGAFRPLSEQNMR